MKFKEKLYNHSPIFLQNLAVSMQGRKLHRMRYSREFTNYLEELLKTQWYTPAQLEEFQLRRLQRLLKHCAEYVPYYRKLFVEYGIKPDDVKDVSDIKKLPMIDKSTIRTNPDLFIADNFNRKKLIKWSTSGTTNTPMDFYFTDESFKFRYATVERFRRWADVKIGDKRASFTGSLIVPPNQSLKKKRFCRYNRPGNQLLLSIFHMSDENLRYYVDTLKSFQPVIFDGYPACMYVLAKYILQNGIEEIRPKAVFVTAEVLYDYQREAIEKAFQAKFYNYYGACEGVASFGECSKGGFHTSPEFGITEILNEHGEDVQVGEVGELVLTGLSNYAMPLIRYRIGDMGIMSDKTCTCGRTLPIIQSVIGRTYDMLYTVERGYAWSLDDVFHGVSHVAEAQIIQESLDRVIIKVVPEKDFNQDDSQRIIAALKARIGHSVDVSIQLVDAIERTDAGKFRAVISKVLERTWAYGK